MYVFTSHPSLSPSPLFFLPVSPCLSHSHTPLQVWTTGHFSCCLCMCPPMGRTMVVNAPFLLAGSYPNDSPGVIFSWDSLLSMGEYRTGGFEGNRSYYSELLNVASLLVTGVSCHAVHLPAFTLLKSYCPLFH